jgi:hypothetical protein
MNWKTVSIEGCPALETEDGRYLIFKSKAGYSLVSRIHEEPDGQLKSWSFRFLEAAKRYAEMI